MLLKICPREHAARFSRRNFIDAPGSELGPIVRPARRRSGQRFRCRSAARLLRILSTKDGRNGAAAVGGGEAPRTFGSAFFIGDLLCELVDPTAKEQIVAADPHLYRPR